MTEGAFVSRLLREARTLLEPQGAVIFKHHDITAGMPDFSVTWRGVTSWWEAKHAKPWIHHESKLQHLRMKQLALASIANYVVLQDQKPSPTCTGGRFVCVVSPHRVDDAGHFTPEYISTVDYAYIIDIIVCKHGAPARTLRASS